MENLAGNIIVSSPSSTECPSGWVQIEVRDKLSHHIMISLSMDFEGFARTLMRGGEQSCHVNLFNDSGIIGMQREYKTELVPRPNFPANERKLRKILKPFEVDGWKGNIADLRNFNRFTTTPTGQLKVIASFVRHVPVTPTKSAKSSQKPKPIKKQK